MDPICVSVLGLTDRKLPIDQCMSIKIQGLCVGSGGINVGAIQHGILLLMRNDVAMDKERYKIYIDEESIPFVSQTRI